MDDGWWLGTEDGRIFHLSDKGDALQVDLRTSSARVDSLVLDGSDRLWAIVRGRLYVREQAEFREARQLDRLLGDHLQKIFFENDEHAWVAGSLGVARLRVADLLDLSSSAPLSAGIFLDRSDGLPSREVNFIGAFTRDGIEEIVIGTSRGLGILRASESQRAPGPVEVMVDHVRHRTSRAGVPSVVSGATDETISFSPTEHVALPSGTSHVEIVLSAPTFLSPEDKSFDFELRGPSGMFRGEADTGRLTLHSPKVGRYELRVVARTRHGVATPSPAVLSFSVAPTVLESWWFIPSAASALVLTMGGLTGYRLRSLRRTAEKERALREAAQRYRQLERKLLETQQLESLGLLAGGIAHDFNNLLTGIMANAELLRDEAVHEDQREMVASIIEASRRAADLCRQMLAYSGRGRMNIEALDLNRMVNETARLLHRSLGPNVYLDKQLEPGVLAVDGDSSQLRQVIMNLLTNANEAYRQGAGPIIVRTSRRPGLSRRKLESAVSRPDNPDQPFCCLEVIDRGEGMDKETLHRIFEPFFTTKSTGRGLGLAATIGITQSHCGALFVESAPGVGSTFMLCIPASQREPRVESQDEVTPSSGTLIRRILVIDDEAAVRATIRRTFQRMNMMVIEAASGAEALIVLNQVSSSLDLVFLDLTMPGMDGAEVLSRLRKALPSLPVILMSGYAAEAVLARVGVHERTSFLQKPFGVRDLLRAANDALAGEVVPS
ncbi:MAG: response regulator [Myxococcales bacterium]|nr:response regulator [Myxococcales bacterium]